MTVGQGEHRPGRQDWGEHGNSLDAGFGVPLSNQSSQKSRALIHGTVSHGLWFATRRSAKRYLSSLAVWQEQRTPSTQISK